MHQSDIYPTLHLTRKFKSHFVSSLNGVQLNFFFGSEKYFIFLIFFFDLYLECNGFDLEIFSSLHHKLPIRQQYQDVQLSH